MNKIAVTSEGPSLDDQVDPRFGRAAGFVVVDLETMDTQYIDNGQSQVMAQGAGIQAAELVARAGVKCLLTGYVGPKAIKALSAAGTQAMEAFAAALSSDPAVNLQRVVSGAEALEAARAAAPHLVIIDADLPDTAPLDLVQKLLMVNATVNTAVVSPLPDEEFHEASEGLGIFARLPDDPGRSDAEGILRKLRTVLGIG